MLEIEAKTGVFLLIPYGFVHKTASLQGIILTKMAFFGAIFDYLDKIRAFFRHFDLSKLFTAKRVIFALMTIARKIMMVISPFLTIQNMKESFKILPSEVTKPNIAFKNGKEMAVYFT